MRRRERNDSVVILGIDPGSRVCGYGIINAANGSFDYVSSGRLVLSSQLPFHERLRELHEGLADIIAEFSPTDFAVEKVFFAKSARSALSLGHARGIVLLAASLAGVPVHEYTPLAVKKAVTGYGRADKHQVQQTMRQLLGITAKLSSDGADALAVALCHANTMSYQEAVTAR